MKISTLYLLILFLIPSTLIAQTWSWARSGIGDKTDEGASLATDHLGNVYATGYFTSPTDIFGNDTLFNVGNNQNMFLVKYDSAGNVIWARSGSSSTVGTDIATDLAGNIYVTGYFSSTIAIFGTDTLTNSAPNGSSNFFLLKYNSNGNLVWSQHGSSLGDVRGKSLNVDASGNIYVTGRYAYNAATFGTVTLNTVGNENIFIVKYNTLGTAIWGRSGTGMGIYAAYGIDVDTYGHIYATGSFRVNSINFGSTSLNTAGGADIYFVKYDSTGNLLWANSYGGSSFDEAYGLATDGLGNIYLTGYFSSSSLTFGSNVLMNAAGHLDYFIAQFLPNGTPTWAHCSGGANNTVGYDIATDLNHNVYVSGGYLSPVSFGNLSITLPPPAPNCNTVCDPAFIIKYTTNGQELCIGTLLSGGDDYSGLATDQQDHVYFGGDFLASPFVVGNDTLTLTNPNSAIVSENIFVAKFQCDNPTYNPTVHYTPFTKLIPNPFTYKAELITEQHMTNANLSVYNIYGQCVFTKEGIQGNRITLFRNRLPAGLYYYQLSEAGKRIGEGRIFIID